MGGKFASVNFEQSCSTLPAVRPVGVEQKMGRERERKKSSKKGEPSAVRLSERRKKVEAANTCQSNLLIGRIISAQVNLHAAAGLIRRTLGAQEAQISLGAS